MHVSSTGEIKGKFSYMAPEQLRGAAERRSDVWSLGVVYYELLTLRPLFRRATQPETIVAVERAPVAPVDEVRPELAAWPTGVVLDALRRPVEERLSSGARFADRLHEALEPHGGLMSRRELAAYVEEVLSDAGPAEVWLPRTRPAQIPSAEPAASTRSEPAGSLEASATEVTRTADEEALAASAPRRSAWIGALAALAAVVGFGVVVVLSGGIFGETSADDARPPPTVEAASSTPAAIPSEPGPDPEPGNSESGNSEPSEPEPDPGELEPNADPATEADDEATVDSEPQAAVAVPAPGGRAPRRRRARGPRRRTVHRHGAGAGRAASATCRRVWSGVHPGGRRGLLRPSLPRSRSGAVRTAETTLGGGDPSRVLHRLRRSALRAGAPPRRADDRGRPERAHPRAGVVKHEATTTW